MNSLNEFSDPMTIINIVALFLTAACLTFLVLEFCFMAWLPFRDDERRNFSYSPLSEGRSLLQRRILRLFEVGGFISLPKRSLAGQRIG